MVSLVGKLLREKKLTIACAESCTGGLLTSKLTDIAGSSEYVKGAIVSYTNEVKHQLLKIDAEVLEHHGAVSREVAQEMSINVRTIFKADIGVGVTGFAGPAGAEVGLVFISVSGRNFTSVQKFNFSGSRAEIKNQAANAALEMIKILLEE